MAERKLGGEMCSCQWDPLAGDSAPDPDCPKHGQPNRTKLRALEYRVLKHIANGRMLKRRRPTWVATTHTLIGRGLVDNSGRRVTPAGRAALAAHAAGQEKTDE